MLERINVISRNEIDRAYKDHVFFKLIRILCQPYVVSLKNFHLLPEEVFQEVMAWLDFISRTEADEDVLVVYLGFRHSLYSHGTFLCRQAAGYRVGNHSSVP